MHHFLFLLICTLWLPNIFLAELVAVTTPSSLTSVPDVKYVNSKKRYSLQYPISWAKNELIAGFDIFIMSPQETDGRSLANVSVMSGDLPKGVSLDEYYEENVKNLKNDIPSMSVKGSGVTKIDGKPAKWIRYTRDDDQTEITHYFFVVHETAFLITTGTPKGVYDQHKEIFDKIINSFNSFQK